MKNTALVIILFLSILIVGCDKDENTTNPGEITSLPEIVELKADRYEIKVGGDDPAILTCIATGGNLNYTWEVDLGDIFAINETGSQVRFTGSECCVGEKIVKCTVSNDRGTVDQTITINIFIP